MGMKKKTIRWIVSLLALLAWMFLIYGMSAKTGEESAGLSYQLAKWFYRLPLLRQVIGFDAFHLLVRKAAHFTEYGILGLLTLNFVSACGIALHRLIYWGTVLFCGVYAALDEYHQSFVEGRGSSPVDVCIDTTGAIVFLLIFYYLRNLSCNASAHKVS